MWGVILGGAAKVIGGLQSRSAVSNAEEEQIRGYQRSIDAVNNGVNLANPLIETAATNAATDAVGAGNDAAGAVNNAAAYATQRVDAGVASANEKLNPYIAGGTEAFKNLSEFVNGPQSEFKFSEDDPSYKWRIEQGTKAIERAQAARGLLTGGGTLIGLNRYVSGEASKEYQAAFDRFNTTQKNRFDQLSGVAKTGYEASGAAGQNDIKGAAYGGDIGYTAEADAGKFRTNAAQYAGDITYRGARDRSGNILDASEFEARAEQGMGDTRSQAHLGRANAWNQVIGGVSDAGTAGLSRFKAPATSTMVPASAYAKGGLLGPRRATWS